MTKYKLLWSSLLLWVLLMAFLSSCNRAALNEPNVSHKPLPLNKTKITVGSKSITEQYLLMKMTSLLLREHGYPVNEMVTLDSDAVRSAMEAGIIDLYWEYTTTARQYYQKQTVLFDPDEVYRAVSASDEDKGIVWLPRSEFNSSWALLMRDDIARQLGIRTISDLIRVIEGNQASMKFGTNDEYLLREDGVKRLQEIYDFTIPRNQIVAMDTSLLPQAVKESRVEVAIGLATDPRIKELHLAVIEDDRHSFPPYHAAPVILKKTLDQNKEISDIISPIAEVVNNSNMMELMYQVDILHKDVTQIAREFLLQKHMLNQ
jgi:osmoprotectant transport system substrate-binding protein